MHACQPLCAGHVAVPPLRGLWSLPCCIIRRRTTPAAPSLPRPRADGLPVATEELRYGLRLAVLGLPAHPLLTTPQALVVVGPAAFGHGGVQFTPLAAYTEVQPIPQPGVGQ